MDISVHLRESRPTRLVALLGLVGAIALSVWLVFAVLRSVQQRTLVMAVYPEGSLNTELVKRYQQVLARNGLVVKLEPSAGAVESLGDLRDPKSGVSVALIPGGTTTKQDSPELVSLGTIFYQPLWVFSRVTFQMEPLNFETAESPSDQKAVALARFLLNFSGVWDGSTRSRPRC